MKISGIYKIENQVNGKCYVGQSVDMLRREREHFKRLRVGVHENSYLQNSFNKYGEENFKFEMLEEVEITFLRQREQHWIDLIGEYNLRDAGEGCALRPEHKAKLSEKSKQQHQKAKQEGKYKVVVIDLVTDEREYYDTIANCPVVFKKYYNFASKKCYFNLSTNTPEKIETKITQTKEKYQNYLVSQTSRPIYIYKKKTKEFVGKYNSISDAARQLNISCKNLSGVLNRNAYNSVNGYVPSYTPKGTIHH